MTKLLQHDLNKYKARKEQKEVLEWIKNKIHSNSLDKFFMLDLPTGVGKSVLVLMIIEFLKTQNKNYNFDILTNSKILQEQYTDEFNSISSFWGKDNYQCKEYGCSCKEGKEFQKLNKTKCESCPFDMARESFLRSDINLTNFHLYILLNIYREDIVNIRKKNVLIIDEAHDFESVFSDFISIVISKFTLKKIGFIEKDIQRILKSTKNLKTIEDFIEYSDDFIDQLQIKRSELKNRMLKSKDVKFINQFNEIESFIQKLENFQKDYAKRPENWILDLEWDDKKNIKIIAQPIWTHPYLNDYFWDKYEYVFFLSGTILNKKLFSYLNGVPDKISCYYSIDSPFKIKNRPIYYLPVSRMSWKNKENAFKSYKPFIEKILKKYKDRKGIFHTVTYEISKFIEENFKSDRLIFHSSSDKDQALKKHFTLKEEPTVLISPSMGTGVDLQDEKARFQVLCKIPYPSLGSKKNKMRQKTIPEWYTYKTIAGIIQAYGRGVRSYNDWCDFLILDACFSDIMIYHSAWIPKYIQGAIKTVDVEKLKKKF